MISESFNEHARLAPLLKQSDVGCSPARLWIQGGSLKQSITNFKNRNSHPIKSGALDLKKPKHEFHIQQLKKVLSKKITGEFGSL
jgi:hypothetical protein